MGFSFRRRIKILPGLHVNLGSKGINSLSLGSRGATLNLNGKGVKARVGAQGFAYETKRASWGGGSSGRRTRQLWGDNTRSKNKGAFINDMKERVELCERLLNQFGELRDTRNRDLQSLQVVDSGQIVKIEVSEDGTYKFFGDNKTSDEGANRLDPESREIYERLKAQYEAQYAKLEEICKVAIKLKENAEEAIGYARMGDLGRAKEREDIVFDALAEMKSLTASLEADEKSTVSDISAGGAVLALAGVVVIALLLGALYAGSSARYPNQTKDEAHHHIVAVTSSVPIQPATQNDSDRASPIGVHEALTARLMAYKIPLPRPRPPAPSSPK